MRKLTVLLFLIFLTALPMAAQDMPRWEVFGGYSYYRPDGGGNFNGWNASAAGNFSNAFAIVGDFAGHYDSEGGISANQYTFLFGPRIAGRGDAGTGFVHALFGAARLGGSINDVDVPSESAFAMALGGGFDWNVGESFGIRIAQVDYLMTRFASDTQNNLRFSAGVVLRFGE
jgi:hypothetical protein